MRIVPTKSSLTWTTRRRVGWLDAQDSIKKTTNSWSARRRGTSDRRGRTDCSLGRPAAWRVRGNCSIFLIDIVRQDAIYDKIPFLSKAQPAFANTMWRQISPRSIFLSALTLLLFSAIAAGWMIYRLYESARWVQHTFEVQLALDTVEKDVAKAGRSRSFFVSSSDPQFLKDFNAARQGVLSHLTRLKNLLSDDQE